MASKQPSKLSGFVYTNNGWKYSAVTRYALFLLLGLVFYFSLSPELLPKKYDIKENTYSAKEITAPKQIKDTKATLKAAEEAAESVSPKYKIIPMRADNLVTSLLDRIDRLNQDDLISQSDKTGIYRDEIPQRASDFILNFVASNRGSATYSDHLLDEMQSVIKEQTYVIPEETYIKIPRLTSQDIIEMKPVARDIVTRLMNDQITDAQTARAKVAEQVSISSLSQRTAREVVQELVRLVITSNKFYDEDATKEAKVQARENTPDVFIEQGDTLVAKGQLITPELYTLLDENGLLSNEVNYWPQLGLLILSAMLSVGLLAFIRYSGGTSGFKYNNSQLLMLVLVFVITIISMRLAAVLQTDVRSYIGFLAPVAIGAMLIAMLLDMPLAYFCSILFSVLASVILNVQQNSIFDFNFGFFAIVVSYVAIFATHRAGQRSTLLKGGIMVSLFGCLTVFMQILLGGGAWKEVGTLYSVGFAFAGDY